MARSRTDLLRYWKRCTGPRWFLVAVPKCNGLRCFCPASHSKCHTSGQAVLPPAFTRPKQEEHVSSGMIVCYLALEIHTVQEHRHPCCRRVTRLHTFLARAIRAREGLAPGRQQRGDEQAVTMNGTKVGGLYSASAVVVQRLVPAHMAQGESATFQGGAR